MVRHWLAGAILTLVGCVWLTGASALAQSPDAAAPTTRTFPPPGAGGPIPSSSGSESDLEVKPGDLTPRSSPRGIQRQGDLLRYVRDVAGDSKPVVLEADQISTWEENGRLAFLLVGKVLVQQSVVQARCEQAVAWVDHRRYQTTGILHLDLYLEGQVRLDNSTEIQDGQRCHLELNTRGEFRVRGGKGKLKREERAREPVVLRARESGLGLAKAPVQVATPVVRPSIPVPASALPPVPGVGPASPILPTSGSRPAGEGIAPSPPSKGPGPQSMLPSKSGPRGPAPSVVRGQSPEPGPGRSPPPPLASPSGPPSGPPPGSGSFPGTVPGSGVAPPGPTQPPPSVFPPSTPPVQPPPIPGNQRQPSSEPIFPGGAPMLPPPSPAPEAPIPPPSRVEGPRRPDELPRTSSPERPLEHRLLPRSGEAPNLKIEDLPGGRKVITVTGGLILNVRNVPKIGIIDVEADRAVIWVKNRDRADDVARNLRSDMGETSNELEFYMAGHVILRSNISPKERTVLEAEEIYYDATRNVAVALQSRLEMRTDRFANSKNARIDEPIILAAPEIFRTGANTFEVKEAEIFSSKLPSDPGLKLLVANATLTNRERPRTFFGQPVTDKKGNPVIIQESIVEAKNVTAELEGVPFFWTPYLVTDARDPLGPLETINVGGNRVFGFQGGLGLNVYKLFGLEPIEGTRWRVLGDYLSRRGPALGTNFSYQGKFDSLIDPNDPNGFEPRYEGWTKLYGIYDQATDILGGNRPPSTLTFDPPGARGRAFWRQGVYDLPYGITVQSQMSLLSDRNFLEQYFWREFNFDPNQANFVYAKMQQDNWALAGTGQFRTSPWITTTQWLPRLDGYLLGQDFFNGLLNSNTQVSLAYAQLRVTNDTPINLQVPPPPGVPFDFFPTTQNNDTGRFAILEELSLPLDLGALKFVPYLKGAAIGYTNDLTNDSSVRLWGGGGARASIPFSRLYPTVESELFNLKGLNHKMVLGANYLYAQSNEPYTNYAELDRLNDDATMEMLHDFKPYEPVYNQKAGLALATSPYFNYQTYAIRRLVDNRIDTLQGIQVLQADLRQRLQTKRGFAGFEHIVDWMVLDTSFSFFPDPVKDNFNKPFGFLEYQYLWNVGDRTTLESSGWYDPQPDGARVFTVGSFFNRPDRTSFYLGYRQIEPVGSNIVLGSVTYLFSPKYAMTLAASYDFGTQEAQNNTLVFTRTGSDLQVSLGFSYNSLQNNFGAIIEIVPTLVPYQRRGGSGFASVTNR